MRDCPYSTPKRSRSSPRLRWAESGPTEHPEMIDVRYFDKNEPSASVSASVSESTDMIFSRPSRTPARRILKPLRTEPFEWRRRSRLRADSFSDELIDWDLATMEYEPKVLISKKDSREAQKRRKKASKKLKESLQLQELKNALSPKSKKLIVNDLSRSDEVIRELNKGQSVLVKHPQFEEMIYPESLPRILTEMARDAMQDKLRPQTSCKIIKKLTTEVGPLTEGEVVKIIYKWITNDDVIRTLQTGKPAKMVYAYLEATAYPSILPTVLDSMAKDIMLGESDKRKYTIFDHIELEIF